MAEMAVSFAVDTLLPLLREESNLLRGIHKDFADIKDELESIQAFLKDAETRAAGKGETRSEGIKTWVKQVIQAAFRIEDIIDDYIIYVAQQPRHPGCVASLSKIAHVIKTLKQRHQIVSEIQDIKSYVHEIKERSGRYDFQSNSRFEQGSSSSTGQQNAKWHDPRIASLYMEDEDVVGFEAPKNVLIDWLVKGREERTVVAVVGMGGQGKTTLAKKVFDSKEVVGYFECRAWITASQPPYSVEGLLRDMLSKLYKQRGEYPPQDFVRMDKESLINEVKNYLKQKRYVVVFDDVWTKHFWDEIQFAVIDNNNGSKIIITTRNIDVVMSCKKSSFVEVHELKPLTHKQSRQLFNKMAFRFDYGGCCPKDLIDISNEIVEKCKGLPLAIVVIGGLLSTKEKNTLAWERFSKNLSSELEKDSHLIGVTRIIGLSYDDLPYHLKPCFLYFGIYPEDYEVKSSRVTRQWIAEGFVKEERGKTLEEVAEGYLAELIRRSLVQASKVKFDGKAKACRVHDLIHVMICEKFEDLSFCKHISEDGQSPFSGIIRRLSIGTTSDDLMLTQSPHVRSLLVFTNWSLLSNDFVKKIQKEYKRLKVLDIEDADLLKAPKNLESLVHLKYLRYTCAIHIFKLPKSIWLLQNLESLDARGACIVVPKEISKLRKLRHLHGFRMSLIRLKDDIGGLTSLQSLSRIVLSEEDDGVVELIRELGKLEQLRKLKLVYDGTKHVSDLSSSISKMQHLETLSIQVNFEGEGVDLSLISFSPMLQKITLFGKLKKFPDGIPVLHNLMKLKLEYSHLTDDPMKFLKNMPNLLILHLHDYAYDGESLHFQDGGYQKLRKLSIRGMYNLNSIVIEKGAIHSLEKLELWHIPNLQMLPTGIQYLEKLQVLVIKYMPTEFVESIAPDRGKDHWVIEHVPQVEVFPIELYK